MIQFQCPHCQAVLRVPDKKMGQRGQCPQCRQMLLVPVPDEFLPAGTDSLEPTSSSPIPQTAEKIPGGRATGTPPAAGGINELFTAISDSGSHSTLENPVVQYTRRSRSRNQGALWTGLFFVMVAVGLGIAGYYWIQPRMEGEVLAHAVPLSQLQPHRISAKALGDESLFRQFVDSHAEDRLNINSQILRASIEANEKGLLVQLEPTADNLLYRVNLLNNPALRDFYAENYAALEKVRVQQLQTAARDFFLEMEAAEELIRASPSNLLEIRDQLILPAVVDALGYRMAAFVEGVQYPCLWQDKEDQLYFAVPLGTKSFEIRERVIPGVSRAFPEHLKFKARSPAATPQAAPAEQINLQDASSPIEVEAPASGQTLPGPDAMK